MNLKEVGYFIQLVRDENFTKAAATLMISQPALSKAMKMLEYDLGVTLIDRECNKRFKLTPEGKVFYENAQIALDNINEQIDILKNSIKDCKNNLVICIPPIMGIIYFTPIIAQFKQRYKNIDIKILEGGSKEIQKKVINHDCDLGIVVSPCNENNINNIKLGEEEVALVVYKGHRFFGREEICMYELENENLILLSNEFYLSEKILTELKKHDVNVNIVLNTPQWYFIMQMIIFKEGVSILPKKIIDRFKADDLCQVNIKCSPIKLNINCIYNKSKKLNTPAKLFIQYIMNCSMFDN